MKMRQRRGHLNLSAQQVADRTEQLGAPISRTVIADLENGRRRYVSTSELVAIAQALTMTPIHLLYPDDDDVEVWPGVHQSKASAVQGFSGVSDAEQVDQQLHEVTEVKAHLESAISGLNRVKMRLAQMAGRDLLAEIQKENAEIEELMEKARTARADRGSAAPPAPRTYTRVTGAALAHGIADENVLDRDGG